MAALTGQDPVLGLDHADSHLGVLALASRVFLKPKQVDQLGNSPAMLRQPKPELPHHGPQLLPLLEHGSGWERRRQDRWSGKIIMTDCVYLGQHVLVESHHKPVCLPGEGPRGTGGRVVMGLGEQAEM